MEVRGVGVFSPEIHPLQGEVLPLPLFSLRLGISVLVVSNSVETLLFPKWVDLV